LFIRVDARLGNRDAIDDDLAGAGSGGGGFLAGAFSALSLRTRREGEGAGHEGDGEVREVTVHEDFLYQN
jgi:hypothetical protein